RQRLVASDAGAWDRFGGSVAIRGDTAVFGARGKEEVAGGNAGAAYVFRFDGS
ncbi:MAG: PKD domain-containing protein, partial [Planctomycetales bacterium]|nr:PKD domain-containing protein [Planctomycetales bacterium]